MKLKKTLILAVLLVAAIVYIWKVDMPAQLRDQNAKILFYGTVGRDLKKLEIKTKKSDYSLVVLPNAYQTEKIDKPKDPSDSGEKWHSEDVQFWNIETLPGADLDKGYITSLMTALLDFQVEGPLPKDEIDRDLEIYGLKEPLLTMKVTSSNLNKKDLNKTVELKFGKKNDYVAKRYVEVTEVGGGNAAGNKLSDGVYLANESLFVSANKEQNELRSKTPLDFKDALVERVTIEGPQENRIIVAREGAGWQLKDPLEASASSDAVTDVFRTIRGLRAVEFIDGDKVAGVNFDNPVFKLNFIGGKGINLSLVKQKLIPDGPEKIILRVDGKPSLFVLNEDPTAKILKDVKDFREKELFKFAIDKAEKLTLTPKGGEPIVLIKDGENWKVNDKPGDAVFIRQYLADLSGIKAVGFPAREPTTDAFATPELTVEIARPTVSGSEAGKIKLEVGSLNTSEGAYFARGEKVAEPFLLSEADFKKINPRLEIFIKSEKPATPLKSGEGQAAAVP